MKKLLIIAFVLLTVTMANAQVSSRMWGNDNVQTITGTVTDNQRPSAYMKSGDGTEYLVHLGPVWFWDQSKYMLELAEATIKGNVKVLNGINHLYPFTIEQKGNTMVLADDNGVTKWGNKGNGRGCYRNNSGNDNPNNCGNCPCYGNKRGNGNGNGNGNGWGRGNCWRNN